MWRRQRRGDVCVSGTPGRWGTALVRLVWSTEGSVTGRNSLRFPQKGAALTECPEEGKGMGNREPTSQHSYDFDILQTSAGLFTNSWS